MVQIVNSVILANNRLVQNRLVQADSQVEESETKILLFDRTLGPEEEDGKLLLSFRHNLAGDATQQRVYRTFVGDKDREARALIEKAQMHMLEVIKVFEELVTSPTETVRTILKSHHATARGRSQTLMALLSARKEHMEIFLHLLTDVMNYERGS